MGFFKEEIAIDLGTANTLIIHKDKVVVNSPSVVAINVLTKKIVAVGSQAIQWQGRTHENIRVCRPLQDGVIADFNASEHLIKNLIKKIPALQGRIFSPSLKMVICIPSGITEVEKRAVKESAERVNAKEVHLIYEPMAAAIGMKLDITQPKGRMIVDIGGGTTEIAVISLFGIVAGRSLKVAGNTFTADILNYVSSVKGLSIGEITAEKIKIEVGSVLDDLKDPPEPLKIRGKDNSTGKPKEIDISHKEVAKALSTSVSRIEQAVMQILAKTPPELSGDILDAGIHMAGGGSLLRGLAERLQVKTGMRVTVGDDPLYAVVNGTGEALKNINYYRPILL